MQLDLFNYDLTMSISIYFHPKQYKDGTQPVMLRIIEGKPVYKTICKVKKEDWDETKKRVRRSNQNFLHLNALISQKFQEYESKYLDLKMLSERIDPNIFFNERQDSGLLLIDTFKEYLKALGKLSAGTNEKYESFLHFFEEVFPKATIDEINEKWVQSMVLYLQHIKKNNGNSISRRLSLFKSFTLYCNKHHSTNISFEITVKKESAKKIKLTLEEIELLKNISLVAGSTKDTARDTFMFQYYCYGSRISDILLLKKKDIYENRIWITQQKTKKHVSVQIHEQLQLLIDKYKDTPGVYLLPFMNKYHGKYTEHEIFKQIGSCTALINRFLDKVCRQAGIDKKVSTHIARHSFATHADKVVLDKRHISKALGHSKFSMTENYLSDLRDDEIDGSMSEVYK